jgi:hypothetical protein
VSGYIEAALPNLVTFAGALSAVGLLAAGLRWLFAEWRCRRVRG